MNLEALHKLGCGLYIVASRKGEKLNGQTANTVFQITSTPPTIAVSINKANLTHEFIEASKVFTVSILSKETPLSFIGRFGFRSGRDINKLEGVSYKTGATGAPVITDNAVAYMDAKVINQVYVGTHTIFIGEIVGAEVVTEKKEEPMTYAYYH
ncbi:MAG: flavin reductase family protein, partial [Chloroflexota bacterium]|nr:flavin reductase family protein [Chloroflexota bacterium]